MQFTYFLPHYIVYSKYFQHVSIVLSGKCSLNAQENPCTFIYMFLHRCVFASTLHMRITYH